MCGLICLLGDLGNVKLPNPELIKHRGPDSSGFREGNVENTKYFMFHNRLAIRELSQEGEQPFEKVKGKILLFNGEIYNYDEIKSRLTYRNVEIQTRSDTELLYEILLNSFWDILDDVDGMFSFVFFDGSTIIYGRDHLGIKPLYLYEADGLFMLSSEIKVIKDFALSNSLPWTVSNGDIVDYFFTGSVNNDRTGIEEVSKIPFGVIFSTCLYELVPIQKGILSTRKSRASLEFTLMESVGRQSIADVPISLLFSGGIDSSLLALFNDNAQLFTVKNNERDIQQAGMSSDYDAAINVSKVIGRDLQEVKLDVSLGVEAAAREVALGIEELCSDNTYLATLQLCKAIRAKGFKVVLSGMGADELFGGYPRYLIIKYRKLFRSALPGLVIGQRLLKKRRSLSKKLERLIGALRADTIAECHALLVSNFTKDELNSLLGENKISHYLRSAYNEQNEDDLSFIMKGERASFLQHNLIVADKASMAASIEIRVPFLGRDLLDYSNSQDSKNAINFGITKYQLKKILFKRINSKLFRRPKAGFSPPLDNLVNQLNFTDYLLKIEPTLAEYNINTVAVRKIFNDHSSGRKNNTYKIWQIIVLEKWINENSH